MQLIENLKQGILAELAVKGCGSFTFEPGEHALRAVAELIAGGYCYDDESPDGKLLIVITRKGIEAVK